MSKFRFLRRALGIVLAAAAALPLAKIDAAAPEWVGRSNANATSLLHVLAKYSPEQAGTYGLTEFDPYVADLRPDAVDRMQADLRSERESIKAALGSETDPQVREDLEILVRACDLRIEGNDLDERLLLTYVNVGQLVFR